MISGIIGTQHILYKYILHQPLNFTPELVGYLGATANTAAFISAVTVDIVCIHWLKWKDTTVLFFGCLGLVGFAVCNGLSKSSTAIFLCMYI